MCQKGSLSPAASCAMYQKDHIATRPGPLCARKDHMPARPGPLCTKKDHIATRPGPLCAKKDHLAPRPRPLCARKDHIAARPRPLCARNDHLAPRPRPLCARKDHLSPCRPIAPPPTRPENKSCLICHRNGVLVLQRGHSTLRSRCDLNHHHDDDDRDHGKHRQGKAVGAVVDPAQDDGAQSTHHIAD